MSVGSGSWIRDVYFILQSRLCIVNYFAKRYGTSERRCVESPPLLAPSCLSVPLVATRRNSESDCRAANETPEEGRSSAAAEPGRTSEPPLYSVISQSSEVTLSLIRFVSVSLLLVFPPFLPTLIKIIYLLAVTAAPPPGKPKNIFSFLFAPPDFSGSI